MKYKYRKPAIKTKKNRLVQNKYLHDTKQVLEWVQIIYGPIVRGLIVSLNIGDAWVFLDHMSF